MADPVDVAALCSTAQGRLVDDDVDDAIALLTKALTAEPRHADAAILRATAYTKAGRYDLALQDAETVLAQDATVAKAHARRGIALHGLKRFADARTALREAERLAPDDKLVQQWLKKPEIAALDAVAASPAAPAAAKPASIRHEWFQSDTYVVVSVFAKNVKPADATVSFGPQTLSVTIRLAHGTDYSLELDLALPIVPQSSSYEVLSTKIEIKLKKADIGLKWPALEASALPPGPAAPAAMIAPVAPASVPAPSYPSSSKKSHNWDALEKDVKKEEEAETPEGDAALQKLFRQIYANGTDEQRRAMNKSFSQSGGTTLSTNWDEVGKKEVEINPPSGMEPRKWEV